MKGEARLMKWEDFVVLIARLYDPDEANGIIEDLLDGYEIEMDDGCKFKIVDRELNVLVSCPREVLEKAGFKTG